MYWAVYQYFMAWVNLNNKNMSAVAVNCYCMKTKHARKIMQYLPTGSESIYIWIWMVIRAYMCPAYKKILCENMDRNLQYDVIYQNLWKYFTSRHLHICTNSFQTFQLRFINLLEIPVSQSYQPGSGCSLITALTFLTAYKCLMVKAADCELLVKNKGQQTDKTRLPWSIFWTPEDNWTPFQHK